MAVDVNEYVAFTGVTKGYAEEILKDAEHAKWHIPSGAAKLEKAAKLIAAIDDAEKEAVVKTEDGKDTETSDGTGAGQDATSETVPDGGSVEGKE